MSGISVANVLRGSNGIRYTLTRDSDSFVVGYVEECGVVMAARGPYDEPVSVGSARYNRLMAAVKDYKNWAGKS